MRDHRIQQPLSTCRAVRQFGCQRSVACVEFAVTQEPWQNQVRVRVTLTDRAQDVTRRQTRLIEPGGCRIRPLGLLRLGVLAAAAGLGSGTLCPPCRSS